MATPKRAVGEAVALDGRRQRSDASRRKIALAMLELVRHGNAVPSAEDVAAHAGVGRRTVFRLFSDMEGIYRELHAIMVVRVLPMLATPLVGQTWRERLEEVVDRRAKVFEEMLPVKAASDAHRHHSQFLQTEHKRVTRMQREALLAVLPATIAAQTERIEALDLALSFEVWRRLRVEQRLPAKQAASVMRRLVRALAD